METGSQAGSSPYLRRKRSCPTPLTLSFSSPASIKHLEKLLASGFLLTATRLLCVTDSPKRQDVERPEPSAGPEATSSDSGPAPGVWAQATWNALLSNCRLCYPCS